MSKRRGGEGEGRGKVERREGEGGGEGGGGGRGRERVRSDSLIYLSETSNVTMQYEPSIPRVKMNDISSAATYINVTITELYELNSHGQVQGKNISLGNVDYNYTLVPGLHQVSLVYQATLANNAYVKFEVSNITFSLCCSFLSFFFVFFLMFW